jgi:sulfur relay (sulfurtransferase) DsrC/TusE family protein
LPASLAPKLKLAVENAQTGIEKAKLVHVLDKTLAKQQQDQWNKELDEINRWDDKIADAMGNAENIRLTHILCEVVECLYA